MNIDDCACVGATLLVSNTIGAAKRIPGEVIKAIIEGYSDCAAMLENEGIPCHLTGGETADVGDWCDGHRRWHSHDSHCPPRRHRRRQQPRRCHCQHQWRRPSPLGSNANWLGSNGLTAARHEALGGDYANTYPETYAPEIAREFIYNGQHQLGDNCPAPR